MLEKRIIKTARPEEDLYIMAVYKEGLYLQSYGQRQYKIYW